MCTSSGWNLKMVEVRCMLRFPQVVEKCGFTGSWAWESAKKILNYCSQTSYRSEEVLSEESNASLPSWKSHWRQVSGLSAVWLISFPTQNLRTLKTCRPMHLTIPRLKFLPKSKLQGLEKNSFCDLRLPKTWGCHFCSEVPLYCTIIPLQQ